MAHAHPLWSAGSVHKQDAKAGMHSREILSVTVMGWQVFTQEARCDFPLRTCTRPLDICFALAPDARSVILVE